MQGSEAALSQYTNGNFTIWIMEDRTWLIVCISG